MNQKERDRKIQEVAESMVGTCGSLDSALEQAGFDGGLESLTIREAAIIDQDALECSVCGWWCEPSEMGDAENGHDFACEDCRE